MTSAALPAWPALMDLPLALAYTSLKEDAFKALMHRNGVRPVDLGTSQLRWRKADLDAAIDRLPLKPAKSPPDEAPESATAAQVLHLIDPAQAALERARRAVRR